MAGRRAQDKNWLDGRQFSAFGMPDRARHPVATAAAPSTQRYIRPGVNSPWGKIGLLRLSFAITRSNWKQLPGSEYFLLREESQCSL